MTHASRLVGLAILSQLLLPRAAVGQNLHDTVGVQWIRHYASNLASGVDVPNDVAVDAQGNIYVTGKSDGNETSRDYYTAKYNPAGVLLWSARYDGPYHGFDIPNAVAVDAGGNVYITGMSMSSDSTLYDYATIKYSSNGQQLWVTRYNGAGNGTDAAADIAVDNAGNVYVTGSAVHEQWGDDDYTTIKYNSSGLEQWVATYDGNYLDEAVGIDLDYYGNVYVTGRSDDKVRNSPIYQGFSDYATIKYSSEGTQEWIARFNAIDTSYAFPVDIQVDGDGNVYVTGYIADGSGSDVTDSDYATVKYNSTGIEQWAAFFDGLRNMDNSGSLYVAQALTLDALGNVYVTGVGGLNHPYSMAGPQISTLKYDSGGALEWCAILDAPGASVLSASDIAVDGAGHVSVTGSTGHVESYWRSVEDSIVTVRYNPNGSPAWTRHFSSSSRNPSASSAAIALDGSGNVIVTGSTGSSDHTNYATIKYDAAGNELWIAEESGPGSSDDYVSAFEMDADGNLYVTGSTRCMGGSFEFLTTKFDASGEQQWMAKYNVPGSKGDYPHLLAVDDSGNVYVVGTSYGHSYGADFTTVKYNSDGILQWVASSENSYDIAYTVVVDRAGNVYVGGYTGIVKYDRSGVQQWSVDSSEPVSALAVDDSGNVYSSDPVLTKYNSNGVQIWAAAVGGEAITLDDSGNVFITGYSEYTGDSGTQKYSPDGVQIWSAQSAGGVMIQVAKNGSAYVVWGTRLIKMSSTGDIEWTEWYPTNCGCSIADLDLDESGNSYVTGTAWSLDFCSHDFLTIKYDTSGVMKWSTLHEGSGSCNSDEAVGVRVDQIGNVYVAGESQRSDNSTTPTIVKYSRLVTTGNEEDSVGPHNYWLSQNYPNPFNPTTEIRFEISDLGFVVLTVYDLLGRHVETLVNERLSPGVHTRQWNAKGLASGMYFYQLRAGSFLETKKLLLIR